MDKRKYETTATRIADWLYTRYGYIYQEASSSATNDSSPGRVDMETFPDGWRVVVALFIPLYHHRHPLLIDSSSQLYTPVVI